MIFDDWLNWLSFGWFLFCWVGYTYYARVKAQQRHCLAAVLYKYRVDWMRALMHRENRISDLASLGNLMQMVNFLASTTIFALAGVITILYSSNNILDLLAGHSFIVRTTQEQVEFKILVLVIVFVYAFFRFTWAMRQHSFCSILISSAPFAKGATLTEEETQFAMQLAKISDRAGHEFNYGLRSYYFALALLSWFVSPLLFMGVCTLVVFVLYTREFKSRTLNFLVRSRVNFEVIEKARINN